MDIINCTKFYFNPLKGFDFVDGQNLAFSVFPMNEVSLLIQHYATAYTVIMSDTDTDIQKLTNNIMHTTDIKPTEIYIQKGNSGPMTRRQ